MKLQVFHRTHYSYAAPVRDSFNELRLQPSDADGQRRLNFILKVLPATRLSHYLDFNLNCVHMFELTTAHSELAVEATSVVLTTDLPPLPEDRDLAPLSALPECARMERCYDFLRPSTFVNAEGELYGLAREIGQGCTDAWQLALMLMRHVFTQYQYQPASTHVHTTVEEVLKLRRGVCQDFAHLLLGLCRMSQIPARYVSGYLYNGPVDQLKGSQASHAWVEIFLPQIGWRGLDPTNNQQVNHRYVKVAIGRDYADVPPFKGTYRGTTDRKLTVDVLVSRLDEDEAAVREFQASEKPAG
jgi:transglutaminase-like putative cysteine protease